MSSSSRSLRTKRAARSVYILPPPASSSTLPLPVYFSSSMGCFRLRCTRARRAENGRTIGKSPSSGKARDTSSRSRS